MKRKKVGDVKSLKLFDPDMDAQEPYGYEDDIDAMRFQETYEAANANEKIKICMDQLEYWRGFEEFLNKSGIHYFDKSFRVFENPVKDGSPRLNEIQGEIRSGSGVKVKIKLSKYNRLFVTVTVELPFVAMLNFYKVKTMLRDYISEWQDSIEEDGTSVLYGRDEYLHLKVDPYEQFKFCTSFEDHKTGVFNNTTAEYDWFKHILAIAWLLANSGGEFTFTYASECSKYLKELRLDQKIITEVKNNNYLLDSIEEQPAIEMDGFFTIRLDDDRMIGFAFNSASYVTINKFSDWNILEERERATDQFNGHTTAEIFKELIGKKIARVRVENSDDPRDVLYAYWPQDFSENQGDFIVAIILEFTDKTELKIMAGEDWTDVMLEKPHSDN